MAKITRLPPIIRQMHKKAGDCLQAYIKKCHEEGIKKFPCNFCINFPTDVDSPLFKQKPVHCKAGLAMKSYFPPTVTWDMVLDDERIFCGFSPVKYPCKLFKE